MSHWSKTRRYSDSASISGNNQVTRADSSFSDLNSKDSSANVQIFDDTFARSISIDSNKNKSRKGNGFLKSDTKTGINLTQSDKKANGYNARRSLSFDPQQEISHQKRPSIHTAVSYGEFEGSLASGSSFSPRGRKVHSAPSSTLDNNENRPRRKKRESSTDDTRTSSGYNSYSELSEFNSTTKSSEQGQNKTYKQTKGSQNELDKTERYSKFPKKPAKGLEDKSSGAAHKRSDSKISAPESDKSSSSKGKTKTSKGSSAGLDSKGQESKTQKVPAIGNVAVTVTNNIQFDPNDPFAFIQPIGIPFHVKLRKCLGPIMAVILLLILAAALGAAIYFASALKATQEKQIDVLRANLAMKIRHIDLVDNMEELSSNDFVNLSVNYCKNMDLFYSQSKFRETYRGCEVVSIKNSYINFTLFFNEKEATSSQIVEVIETSAQTVVKDKSTQLALVDKFELDLNTVEVKMDRKLEPETFNKKTSEIGVTTAKSVDAVTPRIKVHKDDDATTRAIIIPAISARNITTTTHAPTTTTITTTTKTTTQVPSNKKKVPKDRPVYSWEPCMEYDGMYFPHPTDCDMFIQCTNGQKIEQRCTKGLLYHWKELTCVSRFMPNVDCPDPNEAPPRPTTPSAANLSSNASTPSPTTTHRPTPTPTTESTPLPPLSTRKTLIPDGVVLTAIAGKYPERPKYAVDPCQNGEDVNLYPHPDDCAKFIQCVNGQVQNMKCAAGLVFDPKNNACIFPKDPDLLCPDIKPCKDKDDGYFPHPYDCSKFIQCQFKKELVLACQKGLVWSVAVNSCVHKTGLIVCPLDPKR